MEDTIPTTIPLKSVGSSMGEETSSEVVGSLLIVVDGVSKVEVTISEIVVVTLVLDVVRMVVVVNTPTYVYE